MNVRQVTLLHEYLERAAQSQPDRLGLLCEGQRLRWGDIDRLSNKVAHVLRSCGLQRGDRVVLQLENSVAACAAMWATLRAGGVFCPVNPHTRPEKLAYLLRDSGAAVLLTDQLSPDHVAALAPGTPELRSVLATGGVQNAFASHAGARAEHVALLSLDAALVNAAHTELPCPTIPLDLAALIYTSGTTGEAQGVMLTHQSMVAATESIATYLELTREDVVIDTLPMAFDYGLYQWLLCASAGATLLLERSFTYPARVLDRMAAEGVTGFPVVPTMVSLLQPLAEAGRSLPGVRYVTSTAAPLTRSHIAALEQLCPTARIYSMYGLTECKRVSYLPPKELARRPESVGRAIPNMEVFVVDEQGQSVPPGTTGELVVRGPQLMRGYWNKPAATAERLRPGSIPGELVLHTGDYFTIDADGYLYFVGRRDDMIKSRGQKVSPREVEDVLYALAGVREAAVVGVPDAVLGQAIHAYLVLAEGTSYSAQELIHHCATRLEPFMVPARVTFLTALPHTASGKITKTGLETWAREHGSER